MPVTVEVNYSAFKARMARMRKRGFKAREAFTLAMGAVFVQNVVKMAPVDTHRYVRGWMQAAAGAGIPTGNLPMITQSRRRDELVNVLVKQVNAVRAQQARLEGRMELWYDKAGRPKRGYYHKLRAQIEKAKFRAQRAEDELSRFLASTGAVVMMRKHGAALNGYQRFVSGDALNVTIRDKVYGGRGRLIRGNTQSGLALHNLEPHCRVVEKYKHPVARARAALSAAGLQRMKPVYVSQLASDAKLSSWMAARGGRMVVR
jgi:hypothetical protein